MKKITIAWLLVVGCSYLILSCHKPDIPCKKYCQIKSIEEVYHPSPFSTVGRTANFTYNYKRWLDSLIISPSSGTTGTPVNIKVSYNNPGNPVGTRTNGSQFHKLIYQNGRVIRVDMLGADNLYHPKYTYIYDAQGRIIERQDQFGTFVRWEYIGNTKNFARKLIMRVLRPGEGLEIHMKHEFQYDDKVNPQTTWPNTMLVPYGTYFTFYYEMFGNKNPEFEPIPENNWVHEDVTLNFRGSQERLHEFIYTYQYDDVYPVKCDFTLITRNPFIGIESTTYGTTNFIYDCTNNNSNSSKF